MNVSKKAEGVLAVFNTRRVRDKRFDGHGIDTFAAPHVRSSCAGAEAVGDFRRNTCRLPKKPLFQRLVDAVAEKTAAPCGERGHRFLWGARGVL